MTIFTSYSRTLFLASLLFVAQAHAEVLFEETFDQQADWVSDFPQSLNIAANADLPPGWDAVRQESYWDPSEGYPEHHESIEILASNADKARGGTGKSMVSWRESYDPGWNKWNSESMMMKHFPEGHDALFVSFWIKFSPEWRRGGISKLFRIYSWDEVDPYRITGFGGGETTGPVVFWDYMHNSYGYRNSISLRAGPHGENYSMTNNDVAGLPRELKGVGDMALNWASNQRGMAPGGADPQLPDYSNPGSFVIDDPDGVVEDEQVHGNAWMHVAFYVKMNTGIGVKDGILSQWINGQRILHNESIPWVKANSENKMVKWNVVAIGGNDFFNLYPNEQLHEEWYSIDDVYIASEIPSDLYSAIPKPPLLLSDI